MNATPSTLRHAFNCSAWILRTVLVGVLIAPGILIAFVTLMSITIDSMAPSRLAAEIVSEIQSWGTPTTAGNVMAVRCETLGAPTISDEGGLVIPSPVCETWGSTEVTADVFAKSMGKYLALGYALISIPGLILAFALRLGGHPSRLPTAAMDRTDIKHGRRAAVSESASNTHLADGEATE